MKASSIVLIDRDVLAMPNDKPKRFEALVSDWPVGRFHQEIMDMRSQPIKCPCLKESDTVLSWESLVD